MSTLFDAEHLARMDALLVRIAQSCEAAARRHARAGVLLLALNEPDTEAAAQLRAVLGHWQCHCRDRLHWQDLGDARAGVVIAPIGFPSQVDEIGEILVRAIEPYLISCPLLRGAPRVWVGRSLFPDDGVDPQALLRCAQRSLERGRRAAMSESISRGAAADHGHAALPVVPPRDVTLAELAQPR